MVLGRELDPVTGLQKFSPLPPSDDRIICAAGLLWISIMCADIAIKPKLVRSLSEYSITKIWFNNKYCYVMTGRHVSWSNTINPQCHIIRALIPESPLIYLVVRHVHKALGCTRLVATYKAQIHMAGYTSTHLEDQISTFKNQCKLCPIHKMNMNLKNPARRLLNNLYKGPDSYLPLSLAPNPMSMIQLD